MRWSVIPIFALSSLVSACATPYQHMGFRGGVDELQVSDTVYRITAHGNSYTSSERVQDFVLLRASEIALARGYQGFVIGGSANQSRAGQFTTPGQAVTNSTATVTGNGGFATGVGTSSTTYMPPVTHTLFRPGIAVTVQLVQNGGLDARMINASLAAKYDVSPSSQPLMMGSSSSAGYDAAKRASDECEAKGLHNSYPMTPEGKAFMACYTPLYQQYQNK